MPSLWQASTLVLAIAAGLLAWAPWRQAETPKIPLMRFPITLPLRSALIGGAATLSIAPDGRNIVYLGEVAGNQQLFLRPIDQFIAQPLAGTDGAFDPFFSPDGKWVAFFTANKLKKISVHGGAPIDVCTTEGFPRGGWWSSDDFIWYGSINQTVFRLPASGGTPVAVTQLDSANHEISHRFPQVLSDNKTIIYTVKQNNITSFDEANIAVENIDTHHRTILVHGGSYARYIPTGHVLYARGTLINAVPFDLKHPDVAGTPIAAIEGGLLNPLSGYANYCVSNNGILAYVPFGPIGEDDARICWVHRDGTVHALIDTLRPYGYASLSPDGLRLAMTIRAANDDIWIFHLARGTMTRLTFGGGNSDFPSWTPDGKRILYITERGRTWRYFTKLSDGSGAEEELNSSINPDPIAPPSFSPDGRLLVYAKEGNIWTMTLDGDHRASLLLESPANKQAPRFSPDGKWLSYTSNESGRNEVFVVPFPKAEGKWQVSTNGGDGARWTKNGRELLYVEGRTLMTVEVTTTPSFDFSLPKKLFELPSNWNGPFFDPQPDGERVIVSLNAPHPQEATQINVVVGWFDELKQKFARNEQQ
jgi:serine/threonine-protein kinase